MKRKAPTRPCPHCTSTRFAHVPAIVVLGPYVSAAVRAGTKTVAARRDGRAGEALVCLGCGHIDTFMQSFENVLQHPGATEVHVEGSGPYR